MKNTRTRHSVRLSAVVCLAASLGSSGCGGIFDITYLIAGKRYTETKEERKGTGQSQSKVEMDGQIAPDGTITPTCVERERTIERSFTTARTYEYRGGYKRDIYIASTILSAITGGAIAGLTAYLCQIPPSAQNNFAQPISCKNMFIATPFAVDTLYSSIRIATAKKPKLVDKTKTENPLALSNTAAQEKPMACDVSEQLILGHVEAPSDTEQLGGGTNQKSVVAGESLPVQRTPTGGVALISQPNLVNAWITNPHWVLAAVDATGEPRIIKVDRCFALRSAVSVMQPQNITMFAQQCPAPQNVQR